MSDNEYKKIVSLNDDEIEIVYKRKVKTKEEFYLNPIILVLIACYGLIFYVAIASGSFNYNDHAPVNEANQENY